MLELDLPTGGVSVRLSVRHTSKLMIVWFLPSDGWTLAFETNFLTQEENPREGFK